MAYVIHGATLVQCDQQGSIINDGAVAVVDGKIAAVGTSDDILARYPNLERVDATGKALLPGFINSHTHLVLTVMRGTIEDYMGEVIYGYMGPITFIMTPEERAAMAKLGALEALRSGTTTVSDSSRFVGSYADEVVNTGLRVVFSELGADAHNLKMATGEYHYDRDWGQQYLDRTEALIERYHGAEGGRIHCQVASHAPDNCSPWMLKELLAIAHKHDVKRNVHLAQSRAELKQIHQLTGKTSVGYLLDNGWLDTDLTAAHWSHCTEEDIDVLARQGVHMAHCPANSSRRGPHQVKVGYAMKQGVNIAFGTDNMTEDMFKAMQFGIVVHRGSAGGGVTPQPQEILDCATRNGAKALGRLNELGSIEEGKLADLTFISLEHARMRPVNQIVSNIVHYADPGVVDSVMVGGKFLMRDGKVLSMNESDVLEQAEQATAQAWERLLASNAALPSLRAPR
ncbi:amidohydrolase family protein [Paenalcaligenes sp. Me131]|uniref:amidohydrolase family protein n=1 Tax=Paenalcaligenes sp. Me131 TaxID=3392636 RepID=UPI003D2BA1ED